MREQPGSTAFIPSNPMCSSAAASHQHQHPPRASSSPPPGCAAPGPPSPAASVAWTAWAAPAAAAALQRRAAGKVALAGSGRRRQERRQAAAAAALPAACMHAPAGSRRSGAYAECKEAAGRAPHALASPTCLLLHVLRLLQLLPPAWSRIARRWRGCICRLPLLLPPPLLGRLVHRLPLLAPVLLLLCHHDAITTRPGMLRGGHRACTSLHLPPPAGGTGRHQREQLAGLGFARPRSPIELRHRKLWRWGAGLGTLQEPEPAPLASWGGGRSAAADPAPPHLALQRHH